MDIGLTPGESRDLLFIVVMMAAISGGAAAAIVGGAARRLRRKPRWLLVAVSGCLGAFVGIATLIASIH